MQIPTFEDVLDAQQRIAPFDVPAYLAFDSTFLANVNPRLFAARRQSQSHTTFWSCIRWTCSKATSFRNERIR